MKRESCVVGLIMAWAVITLECLANHSLAENEPSPDRAIEFPKESHGKEVRASELSLKLMILNRSFSRGSKVIQTAEKLAERRNFVVHDKPFLCDSESGDIRYFEIREVILNKKRRFQFEDLPAFYKDCDLVATSILDTLQLHTVEQLRISFLDLLTQQYAVEPK